MQESSKSNPDLLNKHLLYLAYSRETISSFLESSTADSDLLLNLKSLSSNYAFLYALENTCSWGADLEIQKRHEALRSKLADFVNLKHNFPLFTNVFGKKSALPSTPISLNSLPNSSKTPTLGEPNQSARFIQNTKDKSNSLSFNLESSFPLSETKSALIISDLLSLSDSLLSLASFVSSCPNASKYFASLIDTSVFDFTNFQAQDSNSPTITMLHSFIELYKKLNRLILKKSFSKSEFFYILDFKWSFINFLSSIISSLVDASKKDNSGTQFLFLYTVYFISTAENPEDSDLSLHPFVSASIVNDLAFACDFIHDISSASDKIQTDEQKQIGIDIELVHYMALSFENAYSSIDKKFKTALSKYSEYANTLSLNSATVDSTTLSFSENMETLFDLFGNEIPKSQLSDLLVRFKNNLDEYLISGENVEPSIKEKVLLAAIEQYNEDGDEYDDTFDDDNNGGFDGNVIDSEHDAEQIAQNSKLNKKKSDLPEPSDKKQAQNQNSSGIKGKGLINGQNQDINNYLISYLISDPDIFLIANRKKTAQKLNQKTFIPTRNKPQNTEKTTNSSKTSDIKSPDTTTGSSTDRRKKNINKSKISNHNRKDSHRKKMNLTN
ncbi:hypothetical protein BB560_006745 [Smittium megazygosporum]|uniref:Uncharacterized protein n=1 Tax=Smittium megazygosporum TaxID=133381 RepID=A0A2T9Y205_9FUNG|nr:hypothetical protein BB560_006745 [Smittium megazygosporum]